MYKVILLAICVFMVEGCNADTWSDGASISDVGEYVEKTLKNAAQEGLNPDDYKDGIQAFQDIRNNRSPAEANARITRAMEQYVDDVVNGRFDPKKAAKKLVIKPDPVNPVELINKGLSEGGTDWIDRLPPQYPQYKLLKEALNKYPEKQDIIIATMERWRWMPRNPGNRYILVNIASYILRAYSDGKEVMQSPIIVGKPYSQTPVFAAEMQSVIFNPEWHVPESIVEEVERKGNLEARGFRWTNGRLVQRSGAGNALGRIKFTINEKDQEGNRFNVYLHSTSSKGLFKNRDRGLSHGCIRVQNVLELAKFVFNNENEWPEDKINEYMEGSRTSTHKLSEEIPVLITYFTAWANDDGTISFVKDVYKQDEKILDVLGV